MLSELLLPAAAVLIPVSAIALTIFESRAITGAAPEARPAPGDPGLDQDAADGGATDGDLCIASQRARCLCGHPRAGHPRCPNGDCGCSRFTYAGGLVPLDYEFVRPPRPAPLATAEVKVTIAKKAS